MVQVATVETARFLKLKTPTAGAGFAEPDIFLRSSGWLATGTPIKSNSRYGLRLLFGKEQIQISSSFRMLQS
jgi:hypothetical protein